MGSENFHYAIMFHDSPDRAPGAFQSQPVNIRLQEAEEVRVRARVGVLTESALATRPLPAGIRSSFEQDAKQTFPPGLGD